MEGMVSMRDPIKRGFSMIKFEVPNMDIPMPEEEEKALSSESQTHQTAIDEQSMACFICRKIFPSDKALYGHMRCHPEREWRGIRPPSNPKNSSSSSSNRGSRITKPSMTAGSSVDQSWPLPSKPVKGRRWKRIAVPMEENPPTDSVSNAVNNLLMLAGVDPPELALEQGRERGEKPEAGEVYSMSKMEDFADRLESSGESETRNDQVDYMRKKRKVGDLHTVDDHYSIDHKNKLMAIGRYRCSICSKSFSSHQALGGHRASHNKSRIERSGAKDPVSDLHQCKTCYKIFPSGQALGGHQRRHRWHSAEDSRSSVTWQETVKTGHHQAPPPPLPPSPPQEAARMNDARRPLEFDLNEMPTIDDDGNSFTN